MAVLLQPVQTVFRVVLRVDFQSRTGVRNNQTLPRRAKALPEHTVQPADALHAAMVHVEPHLPLQFLLHSNTTNAFLLILAFFMRQIRLQLCNAVVCLPQSTSRRHGHACGGEGSGGKRAAGDAGRLQNGS